MLSLGGGGGLLLWSEELLVCQPHPDKCPVTVLKLYFLVLTYSMSVSWRSAACDKC